MRLTLFVLVMTVAQVFATDLYSQNTRLSLNLKNVTVEDVLQEIESKSQFFFMYNASQIDVLREVNIYCENRVIPEILDQLFQGTKVIYEINNRQIALGVDLGAQQEKLINVQGKAVDASGQPLPGVTVMVKETTSGTVTNTDGIYSLSKVPSNGFLVFSFVGMKTVEIPVEGRNTIDVELEENAVDIGEVVAVGYGTQKRSDVIGSVASIKADEITSLRSTTLAGAIQGKISGLQISSNGGNLNAAPRILVRGISTINSNSDPLWVIDGMPGGDYNHIDPNDIASIEVLKDAGATAIYGSRGSNGVILITTKKADPNKKSVSVNVSSGFGQLSRTPEDMGYANTKEFWQIMDEARANYGLSKPQPVDIADHLLTQAKGYKIMSREEAENIDVGYTQFFRNSSFQDVSASTSYGFNKGAAYISFSFRDDKGIEKNMNQQRFSLLTNIVADPLKDLTLGLKINLNYRKNDNGTNGGLFGRTMRGRHSWYPIYDEDDVTGYWNPYSTGLGYSAIPAVGLWQDSDYYKDSSTYFHAVVGTYLQYSIPFIKGLIARADFNVDQAYTSGNQWNSSGIDYAGSHARENAARYQTLNYMAYLTYNRDFGESNVTATVGAERYSNWGYAYAMEGRGLATVYPELGIQPATILGMSAGISTENYIGSYFSRMGYRYKGKYMFEGSLRRDGSSNFAESKRYSLFYALSGGWVISKEQFFEPLTNLFNQLKLIGSIGQTGNQNIPSNVTRSSFQNGFGDYGGLANQGGSGSRPNNVANSDATWETTTSYNAGLDFGLLKNRVSGSFAYYLKDVDGLLLAVPLPVSAGVGSTYKNIGQMKTQGVDLNIKTINIDTDNFKWSSTVNFTTTKNKVVQLTPEIDSKGTGFIQTSGYLSTYTKAGNTLGEYYVADWAGVDPDQGYGLIYERDQQVFEQTGNTVRTGKLIPATTANMAANKFILNNKSFLPTYFGSVGNTFEYKNFDLNVLFTFQGGNYLFDNARMLMNAPGSGWENLSKDLLTNSWKKPGDIAEFPQLMWGDSYPINDDGTPGVRQTFSNAQTATSQYIEDASFIRLGDLSLGYTFPKILTQKYGINNARIYVSGQNLLTITKYKGWDPEYINKTWDNTTNNLNSGTQASIVPTLKIYSLGLSVNF